MYNFYFYSAKKKSNFDATFSEFSVYIINVNHGLVKGWVLTTIVAKPFFFPFCLFDVFFQIYKTFMNNSRITYQSF